MHVINHELIHVESHGSVHGLLGRTEWVHSQLNHMVLLGIMKVEEWVHCYSVHVESHGPVHGLLGRTEWVHSQLNPMVLLETQPGRGMGLLKRVV